jgi:hypothetical protein
MKWYSLNDLANAAKNIENHLEQRSQRKGKELADRILYGKSSNNYDSSRNNYDRASSGANIFVWFFFLFPAWCFIFILSTISIKTILYYLNVQNSYAWLIYVIGGLFTAVWWYKKQFTKERPIVSSFLYSFLFLVIHGFIKDLIPKWFF